MLNCVKFTIILMTIIICWQWLCMYQHLDYHTDFQSTEKNELKLLFKNTVSTNNINSCICCVCIIAVLGHSNRRMRSSFVLYTAKYSKKQPFQCRDILINKVGWILKVMSKNSSHSIKHNSMPVSLPVRSIYNNFLNHVSQNIIH